MTTTISTCFPGASVKVDLIYGAMEIYQMNEYLGLLPSVMLVNFPMTRTLCYFKLSFAVF